MTTLRALWPVTTQFQAKNGSNLVGGKIYIYYQGRTALATTYHDEDGKVVNSNPVLLDNNGRATVFADTAYSYTIVVCDYYGKELFSQDITLHDVTETADEITLIGSDGSIHIDTSSSGSVKTFDMSANTDILATKKSVDDLGVRVKNNEDDIKVISGNVENIATEMSGKKDKQTELNFNGSATKTIKKITQYPNGELNVEFEDIDLPQEVPNVEITSADSSINITSSVDTVSNTKTFDLSVNIEDAPTFGRFVANKGLTLTKTEGNMTLSSDGKIELKKGKGYHFTIRGNYYNDTLYNDLRDISFIEYSRNETIPIIVDGTLSTSQAQPFEISFDVAQRTSDMNYAIAFSGLTSNVGHITGLRVEVHDINSVSVNGGGSSGTTYTAGYGIDITDYNISVKHGKGLKFNVSNELEVNAGKCLEFDVDGKLDVKVGDGLTYNSENDAIEVDKDAINNYVDKSLFILNTDAITDWIDITDEFIFLNGFRPHYNNPTIPQFIPMYSPSTNLLKFFGEMRINRTAVIPTGANWAVMFKYVGNRFYNNKNAPTSEAKPAIYPISPVGNMLWTPVTNSEGISQIGLAKTAWVGDNKSADEYEGIGMQILFANNSIYGTILTNLLFKVTSITI